MSGKRIKNQRDPYYQHTSWSSNSWDNSSRSLGCNSNMGNQNPPGNSAEKVKSPRPTLDELLKMDVKDLCPHCGWRVEPNSKHSRSCRYHNHPDFNPDRNVACMASPAALKHTPAHIALDMDLKAENPNKQDQGQPHQGGRGHNSQFHQGGRGQNTPPQGCQGYYRNQKGYYDPNPGHYYDNPPPGY